MLALTFVAARACQESQVRIDEQRAITIAEPRAGFDPARTQVRLVRQGLNGRPYWAVSFSTGSRVTTVRIDANTGSVEAVNRER